MKPDKVFVRYKNLNENPPYPRERNEKRTYQKKKYAQKSNKTREPFKIIFDSFAKTSEPSPLVKKLSKDYPNFFNKQSRDLEKDNNDLLNEYLIFNTKKFLESLKEPKKEPEPILSSSDPDWNSDEDIDCDMQSKTIDQKIVQKIVEKMKDKAIRKPDTLKPHQRRFLEDQIRNKRLQEQEEENYYTPAPPLPRKEQIEPKKKEEPTIKKEPELPQSNKPKLIWSEYQERQLNTFVDMGFMTKIQENQEENPIEVVQDDDLFNQDSSSSSSEAKIESPSESEEEDDIFGDDSPTTTVKTKKDIQEVKPQSEKKITQGTVVINEHIFSTIAESVGLLPARCNWIIKNEFNKYKVSTEYMDAYYRKQKMYQILPLISLNHSPFVNNSQIGTPEAQEQFKDFNHRRSQQNQFQSHKHRQYKEKNTHTHLKKK